MLKFVARPPFRLRLPAGSLELGPRCLLMGILNVTPDSFSDGGRFCDPGLAADRAMQLESDGADIIDIGGESTRPGSERISEHEELKRVAPVIERLRGRLTVPVSIDTIKPGVARAALAAGAQIVNFPAIGDIQPMAAAARQGSAPLIVMHSRGTPQDMHRLPPSPGVVREVMDGLRALRDQAVAAGLDTESLVLDPGFGFGKNGDENYELLASLDRFHELGFPLLAGTSRKSFIGRTLNVTAQARQTDETHPRAWGTAATVVLAMLAGVHMVRVHDVKEMKQVAQVTEATLRAVSP